MKKYILVLLLFITSCTGKSGDESKHDILLREQAVNQILLKASAKLKEEMSLHPFGTGGQTVNGVEMLALSFVYYQPITIEEGRKLLFGAANRLLEEINRNQTIQPFLKTNPFDARNVEIRIFPKNRDGSEVKAGSLGVVSMIDGVFKYKAESPSTGRLEVVYAESYETACDLLK